MGSPLSQLFHEQVQVHAGGATAPVSLRTVSADILVPMARCPLHTEARVTSYLGSKLKGDREAAPRRFLLGAPWWQRTVITAQSPAGIHPGKASAAGPVGSDWGGQGRVPGKQGDS